MKLSFEVATVPVAIATVSLILVCAIARLVVGVIDSTVILQGYSIEVIALIASMGIAASSKKKEWELERLAGAQQWKLPPHSDPPALLV